VISIWIYEGKILDGINRACFAAINLFGLEAEQITARNIDKGRGQISDQKSAGKMAALSGRDDSGR
jgi:hypothetical protein